MRKVRIGMVNYINTAPIYETWKTRSHPQNWHVVEAPPSSLNRMLANGELDLGFVSSYEYGVRPEEYRILSDLSISANGSVGSVFLFSRVAPSRLNNQYVLLSGQSETSISLVKILLEEFFHVYPKYEVGDVNGRKADESEAILAIGDEALRLSASDAFPYKLDLAEVWCQHTDLPFVFAVCAAREEFCREYPEIVSAIHREFLFCKGEGRKHLESICEIVAPRIPMHPDECYVYLRAIEYGLGGRKQLALETFFQYLIDRNEASPKSVPLNIFES
ncbi:MAG: menaquinone biosynthesis protein [Desulfocapsa sp.]|uniref:Chorismate dehydratase n=1 Tax=Desulfotalea psychrophila TaxID=84980 RepID=A0ABS3AUS2_9BACT|nr:menaquinone biosynthesis protein [Desulfocapsa sp.]MBN4068722.1 menaquinone biosynthesis protein [Desulfotalea psychrophila]